MKRLALVTVLSVLVVLAVSLAPLATPKFIHYQGFLNDDLGDPVPDVEISILFTIYDSEGAWLWDETQSVTPNNGKFNVKLGSVNDIDNTVFDESDPFLGITVGSDDEMIPRTPIGSVPYAFMAGDVPDTTIGKDKIKKKSIIDSLIADTTITKHQIKKKTIIDSLIADTTITKHQIKKKTIIDSLIADTTIGKDKIRNKAIVDSLIDDEAVTGAHIRNNTIKFENMAQNDATPGQVMKWDGDNWEHANDEVGMTDNDWELSGNILHTSDEWGIARVGNMLYGQHDSTHVNLGVACTTGYNMGEYKYITISGGIGNKAEGEGSVIAGGGGIGSEMDGNWITGGYCVIGGGSSNFAGDAAPETDVFATVAGGRYNQATGYYSVVSGGGNELVPGGNNAIGDFSVIGGGSGNIAGVVGLEAVGTYTTVGGGYTNQASGDYSTVGGGQHNSAQGTTSVISGGSDNEAMVNHATVSGGSDNHATGQYSVVSGGVNNQATSAFSVVSGGSGNYAMNLYATVGGGGLNWASAAWTTVPGGEGNHALASYCVVGGGANNEAGDESGTKGNYATVGGGSYNQATGESAVVAGGGGLLPGQGNVAGGDYSAIGGGYENEATGDQATIGGGWQNQAEAGYSVIGGGENNNASSGDWSVISGGRDNIVLDQYSVIGGGKSNQAASSGVVGGGGYNTASGNSATVGGGQGNAASGSHSTVPGGFADSALADYSFAAGYMAKVQLGHQGTFVWSSYTGVGIGFESTQDKQFLINSANGVGINTNSPTEALDVNGNVRIRQMPVGGVYSVKVDGAGILYQQTSSRKYKRDIRDLVVAAEPVLHLRPVSFQWKESGVDDIGLIAEEVEKLVPELVIYNEQGQPDGVKYDQLSVLLLGVVKQQQLAIDKLTSQAAATEELKLQLGQLQQQVETLLSRQNAVSGGSDELASSK